VVSEGFSATVSLGFKTMTVYAGLVALLLNLTVAAVGTAVLERLRVPRGADTTDLPSRLVLRRRPETGANHP
jgi:SSS family solute:Na+ symporter